MKYTDMSLFVSKRRRKQRKKSALSLQFAKKMSFVDSNSQLMNRKLRSRSTLRLVIVFFLILVMSLPLVKGAALFHSIRQGVDLFFKDELESRKLYKDKLIGVFLAIAGSSFTSFSLCIQKQVHLEKNPQSQHFLFSLRWWQVFCFLSVCLSG